MKLFIDLWWYFKKEKWQYLLGILFLMGASFLSMIPPYVVGVLVDKFRLRTLTPPGLMKWISFLIVIGIIYYAFGYFWRQFIFGSAIKLSRELRDRLFGHFTKMSSHFFHHRRIGDLMAHSTNDIRAVEDAAGDGILTLVDSITMGAMVIFSMAVLINWKLTLIALVPMPFMAWATSHYGNLLHERFHKAQAAFSDLNDKVQESVSGVRVTKAFGLEDMETQTFTEMSQDVVDKNVAVARIDALFDPTITFIVSISFFLSLTFGAIFVVHGSLTIGQLTSFTLYLGQLIWPMLAFGFLFNIVERGRASYDRIFTLLNIEPAIVDKPSALDQVPTGDVMFKIDSFTYPEASLATLNSIMFTLPKGQTLGVVGKTGSGKTTLWKLLLREFEGCDGFIQIGDNLIDDVTLNRLREAIGYVPQDHFLFSATIAENIAFAKSTATQEEIEQAAKLAQIHEDILQFEKGYNTLVGERGVTLSGGQKQRLSIARALILDPEILILDDALSAVDAKTEEAILSGIKENQQNKTTFISTHRMSTIQHADLIIVLEDGTIVERGTHTSLIAANQWYAMMYRRQQLESLVEKGGQTS
jgi:ATP-binding cassette subfamily B multidrug efflux pump